MCGINKEQYSLNDCCKWSIKPKEVDLLMYTIWSMEYIYNPEFMYFMFYFCRPVYAIQACEYRFLWQHFEDQLLWHLCQAASRGEFDGFVRSSIPILGTNKFSSYIQIDDDETRNPEETWWTHVIVLIHDKIVSYFSL